MLVLTPQGVAACTATSAFVLVDWCLSDGKFATLYSPALRESLERAKAGGPAPGGDGDGAGAAPRGAAQCLTHAPGACVMTRYGSGVVVGCSQVEGNLFYEVLAAETKARLLLHCDEPMEPLRSAPGLRCETTFGRGVCRSVSCTGGAARYVVQLGFGIAYLGEAALLPSDAPAAVPLLHALRQRALSGLKAHRGSLASRASKLREMADSARESVKQIAADGGVSAEDALRRAMADTSVRELLGKGQERVRQLLQRVEEEEEGEARNGGADAEGAGGAATPIAKAKHKLNAARRVAQAELQEASDGLRRLLGSASQNGEKGFSVVSVQSQWETLVKAAEGDEVLSSIVRRVEAKGSEIGAVWSTLKASKTGAAVSEGAEELRRNLNGLLADSRDTLSPIAERSRRFIERMGAEDGVALQKANELMSAASRRMGAADGADGAEALLTAAARRLGGARAESALRTLGIGGSAESAKAIDADSPVAATMLRVAALADRAVQEDWDERRALAELFALGSSGSDLKAVGSDITARAMATGAGGAEYAMQLLLRSDLWTCSRFSGGAWERHFALLHLTERGGVLQAISGAAADEAHRLLQSAGVEMPPALYNALLRVRKGGLSQCVASAAEDAAIAERVSSAAAAASRRLAEIGQGLRSGGRVAGLLKYFGGEGGDGLERTLEKLIGGLDAEGALREAELAFSDQGARQRLLDRLKNGALAFFLELLPALEIPPVEGDGDGVKYAVRNLDLTGLTLDKDDVRVTVRGLGEAHTGGSELLAIVATDVGALLPDLQWTFAQQSFPFLNGEGKADAQVMRAALRLGFSVYKYRGAPVLLLSSAAVDMEALELTIRDDNLSWLYNALLQVFTTQVREYLCAALEFELREATAGVLARLHDLCAAHWPQLLRVQQGLTGALHAGAAFDFAKAVEALPDAPRELLAHVQAVLREAQLAEEAGSAMPEVCLVFDEGKLGLALDVRMGGDDAPEGGENTPKATRKEEIDGMDASVSVTDITPGGQAAALLAAAAGGDASRSSGLEALLADASAREARRRAQEGEARRSSSDSVQARVVLLTAALRGAKLVRVAGESVAGMSGEEVLRRLKEAQRPVEIALRPLREVLSAEQREKLKRRRQEATQREIARRQRERREQRRAAVRERLDVRSVELGEGPLGLRLRPHPSVPGLVAVHGFQAAAGGAPLQAQRSGKVRLGDVLLSVEDTRIFSPSAQMGTAALDMAVKAIRAAPRPMRLRFAASPDFEVLHCKEGADLREQYAACGIRSEGGFLFGAEPTVVREKPGRVRLEAKPFEGGAQVDADPKAVPRAAVIIKEWAGAAGEAEGANRVPEVGNALLAVNGVTTKQITKEYLEEVGASGTGDGARAKNIAAIAAETKIALAEAPFAVVVRDEEMHRELLTMLV